MAAKKTEQPGVEAESEDTTQSKKTAKKRSKQIQFTETPYDLVVIGSGPAGIHAAVQASKLNKRVCVIEKMPTQIGGAWIHTGTLPSKTLRESLASIHSIKNHVGQNWVDRLVHDLHTDTLLSRARKVSQQEEALIRRHLSKNNIDVIEGYGSIENRYSVRVIPPQGDQPFTLNARFILIGTGSRPRRPEDIPFDGWRVVDSDEVLKIDTMPKKLFVYGAGVVGCEYACIFSAMGVDVTVMDSRTRILQYLDSEVGTELQRFMETLGVKFVLGQELKKVEVSGPKVTLQTQDSQFHVDVLFYAAGRVSTTQHIGLDRVGIEPNERGAIQVNENFQTSIANIYAAGDAIGPPALAATSSQQGRHVVCHAFGLDIGPFPTLFPIGVYTIPELSMVGETEEQLTKTGVDYVVGRANYSEIARGYIRGDAHGLLKILVCRHTQKILGIHIVGDDACNLVHIGLAFMLQKGTVQDLIKLIFNYPTLAEGYRIAAFNALNKIFPDGVFKNPVATTPEKKV
ncbi:MAG: Si-specific NAD(P)(+) transhydrogenase [Zetaproteobacteria bacterium]|nr:Si-specific NAD(P)(+) transhydrogenase [Zetaproteobacteria bacterium]